MGPSYSKSETTLPEETLQLFRSYVEGISLSDLEKERAAFSSGHQIRSSILNTINDRIEINKEFPFHGSIKKIGSCWDGSKVGQLDEVDTLFVLDPRQVTVIHNDTDILNVRVSYNGNEYSVCQLSKSFANALEKALEGDPPEGMEHNGFAAPEFSGVRMSGPAVTVLYRTAAQCGPIEQGTMVSLDITLAVPFKQTDVLMEIGRKIDYIISATDSKPIDPPRMPHLIPYAVTGKWKPSTAHLEAKVLHELDGHTPLKRAHLLLKCLQRKVDKFSSAYKLFDVDPQEENRQSVKNSRLALYLTTLLRNGSISRARQCMKYGYVLLTPMERKQHNELEKNNISSNNAAIKHLIFHEARPEHYIPQLSNEQSTLELMKAVILEFARQDSYFVQHFFHPNFPAICKFSARENLDEKVCEMATKLRQMYDVLHCSFSGEVSFT